MSGKLFVQIVILIVIGCLLMVLTKCTMLKCPIMGKFMKCSSCVAMQK